MIDETMPEFIYVNHPGPLNGCDYLAAFPEPRYGGPLCLLLMHVRPVAGLAQWADDGGRLHESM